MKKRILEIFVLFVFAATFTLTATSCASLAEVQLSVIPPVSDIVGTLTPDQLMKDLIKIANGTGGSVAVYRAGEMYIVTWLKAGAVDPVIVYYNSARASISEAMIVTRQGLADILNAAKSYGFVAINAIPVWLSELGLLTPYYDARGFLQFSAGGGYSLTIIICPLMLFDTWMGEYDMMIEPVRVDS
jgi:hypothetical protein